MALPILVAVVSFGLGVALHFLAIRRSAAQQHSTLWVAWLLIAFTPVFLVFTFFPDSSVSGQVQGFTAGGAIAAFFLVWSYGAQRATRLATADRLAAELAIAQETVADLRDQVTSLLAGDGPAVLAEQQVYTYRVAGRRGRRIGLITGDLFEVRSVDLWVNSENTNMQMSRFYEGTVSAVIRYHGARKDHAGCVQADVIADELADRMGSATAVEPATVFVTSAGALAETHNVRAVLHVAAVDGQPGAGYTRVHDIGRCVRQVLDTAEAAGLDPAPRSIIFPLLGTGTARAGLEPTARLLLTAAIEWLASDRSRRITTVYFLAFHDTELRACRRLLAESGRVSPIG